MGVSVDGLPVGSFVYTNTFDDVAHQLELCRTHQLGPSLAIYEAGLKDRGAGLEAGQCVGNDLVFGHGDVWIYGFRGRAVDHGLNDH